MVKKFDVSNSVTHMLALAVLGAISIIGAAGISGCSGVEAAPNSTFVLLDGSQQTTAELKGKLTLVNMRGEIVNSSVGEPDFAALHKLIEKLLAES